ncbi:MAG: hypothetical protein K0S51_1166 [Bacillales bacterium]|jgi:hypothetical protein|nr:hypothetical protein [Bacillales bacterium]
MKLKTGLIAIALFITLLIGITEVFFGKIIFYEGNPINTITAIMSIEDSKDGYAEISRNDKYIKLITKTGRYDENINVMKNYMKEYGWEYKEQMGAGYFFEKGNKKIHVSTRQYTTSQYFVWEVPIEAIKE